MTNIKIFVSNRIDKRAQQIDNPIFIPVRCGAVFDKLHLNANMLGDNTGDNISEKRMSFCELTVQYWAWKNQTADYFGICHYRRYISFKSSNEKKSVEERNNGCITIDNLSDENVEKFGLTETYMRKEIEKYDAIFIEPIDLSSYNFNNYSAMQHSPDYHIMRDMDIAMEIICEKYPDMKDIVHMYMYDYKYEYLYNCFVMRAELFDAYSKWLFDILFELEKRTDMSTYTMKQYRTPGTIAERLLGIYILYLKSLNRYKIKHNTLLFVEDTEPAEPLIPAFSVHNVPIVLYVDNNCATSAIVLVKSIVENLNHSKNFDFIIFTPGLNEKYNSCIKNIVKHFSNISIRYYKISKFLVQIDSLDHNSFKLFVPFLLLNYDKCIILDTDTIVNTDISQLYDVNLDENYLAAVKDLVVQGQLNGVNIDSKVYSSINLNIINPYNCINTGVLVLNNKLIREHFTFDFIKHFIEDNIKSSVLEINRLVNKLFDGNIVFLQQTWNYIVLSEEYIRNTVALSVFEDKFEYDNISGIPFILHYYGTRKPWVMPTVSYADVWWRYARNLSIYEELLFNLNLTTILEAKHLSNNERALLKSYNNFVLDYWRVKLLAKITRGQKKSNYLNKKKVLKYKINLVKNIRKKNRGDV